MDRIEKKLEEALAGWTVPPGTFQRIAALVRGEVNAEHERCCKLAGEVTIKMLGERRPDDSSRKDAHDRCKAAGEVAEKLRKEPPKW